MANLSQEKRQRMLNFLNIIKKEHKDNDEALKAIYEIENELVSKKYGLVWEEHEENVDIQMRENIPVFTEIKDKEIIGDVNNPNFNFLLEGDNLHSLKLLEKTHKGKIDVIYIDPPYNRGKGDFIYNDDYVDSEDAFKHSKWLSFMEKRLKIARLLLKENGLIFISIDDNEDAQLKLLCDEIFSPINFVNKFIWQRNSSVKTEKDKFTTNTEYVLLYSKTRNFILNPTYKPLAESTVKTYNKDDGDGRGKYATISLQKPRDPGPETSYDYVDNTGKVWKCPNKGWRMTFDKVKALENDNRLVLNGRTLRVKDYWNERISEGKRIDTLWNDLPENTTGSSELDKVLGKRGMFDNPKPTELIRRCLEIGPKNAIILDFFAGSGTTGHTVEKLNKDDGGNRKYILCTNNENNICEEVTYQRLKNIQEELPHNLKYYKTDYIPKIQDDEDTSISDDLLSHIKEMVQLEHGISIDNDKYHIILTDGDADRIEQEWENYKNCKAIYVSKNVLLTASQNKLFSSVDVKTIPDYYFENELREVGEIW